MLSSSTPGSGSARKPGRRHPKLTPYRLAFFVTTGGLGIAKAVLVSKGRTVPSTTVEWVSGVVAALSFQFLGAYEYNHDRSAYIDWMFSYDLLSILHTTVGASQRGVEASASPNPHAPQPARNTAFPGPPPIITAYRLMVSISVFILGLAKMLCAYLGFSTAMNTFDWIIAVPLTLGLYYLGIFEDQIHETPRRLFDVNYSDVAKRARSIAVLITGYLTAIALCVFWMKYWSRLLFLAWHAYRHPPIQVIRPKKKTHILFRLAVKFVTMLFSLAMMQIGTMFSGVLLWPILSRFNRRMAKSVRYFGLLFLFISLYITCLVLLIFALMLIGAPSPEELAQWTSDGFIDDKYSSYILGMVFILLVRFWQQFMSLLVIQVPGQILDFYHSYSID